MSLRLLFGLVPLLFGAMLLVNLRSLTGGKAAPDAAPTLSAPAASLARVRERTAPPPPPATQAPARAAARGAAARGNEPEEDDALSALPRGGQMYRWRDASGRIHIESQPPPVPVAARVIPFQRTPAKSPRIPETRAGAAPVRVPAPVRAPAMPDNPLSIYTPEGLEDLFDQVEDTAARLQERRKELETFTEQLRQ